MAKEAGVFMTETRLFPAKDGAGYFATRRFDREESESRMTRLHVHTAGGLLHSDFRTPSLDYEDLLALTEIITRDARELEKISRHNGNPTRNPKRVSSLLQASFKSFSFIVFLVIFLSSYIRYIMIRED